MAQHFRFWLLFQQVPTPETLLSLAYDPKGNCVVTDDIEGGLAFWDVRTGKKLFCSKHHYTMSQCIRFNPKGDLIASGGMTGTLVVTDVINGKTIWSKQAHADMIRWLHFSPDNNLLACVGEDHKLTLWNAYSGEKEIDISTGESLLCVAFSPNNQWIAAGTDNGTVLVWALPSMEETWKISVSNEDVHFVSFSADSEKLLTGGVTDYSAEKEDQRPSNISRLNKTFKVKVWDFNKRYQEFDLNTDYTGGWNRGAVSPTAPLVAARSGEVVVSVWNYLTGDEVGQLKGHGSTVFCMEFDASGTQLATCSQDGTVRIWDIDTYKAKLCIVDPICAGAIFTESVGLNPGSIVDLTTRGAIVLENDVGP